MKFVINNRLPNQSRIMSFYTILGIFIFPFFVFAQQKGVKNSSEKNNTALAFKNTYAVVVGISDYQDKDIPDLRFADKDAEAFANFLRSPAGGALDGDHLQLLTNTQATAGRIAEALDALIEKVKKDDQVIIYFSGHGDVERKTVSQPGFLLAWDAPSRVYMGGGTYSLAFLQEVVTTLSTQNLAKVIVITDACHAGKLSGNQIGGSQLTAASLAKQYANEVKILSCQPNEFSLEGEQWGGGRGVFSYHLVDGLFGLADRNNDGLITLGEIDRYLEDHVTGEAAPQNQAPILLGNKTDRIATVNANILADLKKNKSGNMAVFAATESRGFEEEILAKVDTSIKEIYKAFKLAVQDKRFFTPAGNSADEYFTQLNEVEVLAPLQGIMKRNYAAALQDDAQQVLNTMLKTGLTSEVLSAAKASVIYRNYPLYLDRAAQLLGKEHYMYPILQARKHYFEGSIQKDPKKAKQNYFQALQWQSEMPHAYAGLINQYRLSKLDSAEYYAFKAMEIAPSWVKPYVDLALLYSNYEMYEKAIAALNKAGKLDSNSLLVWYFKGHLYSEMEDFNKAEYWYLKLLSADSGEICFPCAYNAIGTIYYKKKRLDQAEQYFKKAIHRDSTFAIAYNNLGTIFKKTQRSIEAEQYYIKAILLDSTNFKAHIDLGSFYIGKRKFIEAEQLFKKAIVLDSTQAQPHLHLGHLYKAKRQNVEAKQSYIKALHLDSTDATIYSNLGVFYLTIQRRDDAQKYLEKGVQMDSTSATNSTQLGFFYDETGRYNDAEKELLRAIQLDSINALAWYNLACNQSLQKKLDNVFDILEKSLLLDPYQNETYNNYNFLQKDTDLTPLREKIEQWNALMRKYFPDKVKY